MILSASRRTDIPNYYSEWFYHRIKEGYLYVRNPVNPHQVSEITLHPDVVDCIVFWTKNPKNMMARLAEIGAYPYYFQFTLTGYGKDIEPDLPDKRNVLIPVFQNLSATIGADRVIWRYDPVLLNRRYTVSYHIKAFREIAKLLKNHTHRVVISFLDVYPKIKNNMKKHNIEEISEAQMLYLSSQFSEIALENHMDIVSCGEAFDLQPAGVAHGSCIDKEWIEKIIGCPIRVTKDKNQREACGCVESVDIGAYDTCKCGCIYCYAESFRVKLNRLGERGYEKENPLLGSSVQETDRITVRKTKAYRQNR